MDTLEPEAAYIQKQITGAKRDKVFLCADSIQTVQKFFFFFVVVFRLFFCFFSFRYICICVVKADDYPNSFKALQAKHLHSIASYRCCFNMVQFLLPLDYVTLRDCTFQSE